MFTPVSHVFVQQAAGVLGNWRDLLGFVRLEALRGFWAKEGVIIDDGKMMHFNDLVTLF